MFGKLSQTKAVMVQQFARQFYEYQGQLVYRAQQKGPPIKVTEDEVAGWIAEFEKHLMQLFWVAVVWFFGMTCGLIILDESAGLPIPDWLPLVVALLALPASIFYVKRLNLAPSRALAGAGRPAMGGERNKAEMKIIAIRQMPWNAVVVPIGIGVGGIFLLAFANPQLFADHPILSTSLILFVLYMLFGGLFLALKKYQISKQQTD